MFFFKKNGVSLEETSRPLHILLFRHPKTYRFPKPPVTPLFNEHEMKPIRLRDDRLICGPQIIKQGEIAALEKIKKLGKKLKFTCH